MDVVTGYSLALRHITQMIEEQAQPTKFDQIKVSNPLPLDAHPRRLGLDTKVLNGVLKTGVTTIREVIRLSNLRLSGYVRNFGPKSLEQLDYKLAQAGHKRIESTLS